MIRQQTIHRTIATAAVTALGLLTLGAVSTPADAGTAKVGAITVTGSGSTSVQRDRATTSLSVSVLASTAKDAMAQASSTYTTLRNAILGVGVKAADLTTSGVSLAPEYDYPAPSGSPVLRGYRATIGVSVVSDITTAAAVLDTAVTAGGDAVQIGGVSLDVADPTAVAGTARTKAVADAKQRAADYAKALGERVGRATKVVETASGIPTPIFYGATRLGVAAADAITIDPGTQKVTASVSVTFELLG